MTDHAIAAAHRPDAVSPPKDRSPVTALIPYAGYMIPAAGFTAETFAAALDRAMRDGLTMTPGRASGTWIVTNPSNGREYVTHPRHGCSCRSTLPCKHRSLAILLSSILRPPARPP